MPPIRHVLSLFHIVPSKLLEEYVDVQTPLSVEQRDLGIKKIEMIERGGYIGIVGSRSNVIAVGSHERLIL